MKVNNCVEVQWTRACATGGCVSVGWRRACSSATNCVEVDHREDRVYVRDGKLGDESPMVEFTPSGWRGFLIVAQEWGREFEVLISGVKLSRMAGLTADTREVCVRDDSQHLEFTAEEWDEFVEGVKAGKFDLEAAS